MKRPNRYPVSKNWSSKCAELTVHAQVEEEIFYPAVKVALKDRKLVPEATVEHATLKALIGEVKDVVPDGEMFDAKIRVLSEYVKHHVKEEQNEMFPKVKASRLDLLDLGEKISKRKGELLSFGCDIRRHDEGRDGRARRSAWNVFGLSSPPSP